MCFEFLASEALHCTRYHAEHIVFAISAMDVHRIDTYPAGTLVNFQRSGGNALPTKILGPSERGADYWSIKYERSVRMSLLLVRTPPQPTPAPSTANWSERSQPGKKVQLKLNAFLRPPSAPPADEPGAVQLTGESSPPNCICPCVCMLCFGSRVRCVPPGVWRYHLAQAGTDQSWAGGGGHKKSSFRMHVAS